MNEGACLGGGLSARCGTSQHSARHRGREILMAAALLGMLISPARAVDPLPDSDASMKVGLAQKATSLDEPMRLAVKVKDPADASKTIFRDIVVTDIPKYDRPVPMLGETERNYGLRVIAAQEAHSKLKAEKIAQAIDSKLGNGRATVTQTNLLSARNTFHWNYLLHGDKKATPIKNGQVTVTGSYGIVSGPSEALQKIRNDEITAAKRHNSKPENRNNKLPVPALLGNNHTGEISDTIDIKPGGVIVPPGTSPRARGSMGTMGYELERQFPGEFSIFGLPMVATGVDAEGNPSLIEFGIFNTYVASLVPSAGQSDEQIYLTLESLLDSNGLPATYDSFSRTLSLDGTFGEVDALYWAASDTGFANFLTVSFGVSPIPEPGTALLLATGLAVIASRRYGHPRRPGRAIYTRGR